MENFVPSQTQQNEEFINQSIHNNELVKQLANKVDALATHKSEPKEKEVQEKPYVPPPSYQPPVPFPQRPTKSKTEVITQMRTYAKFLKEILSNKRKLDDDSTIELTEECNAIIQNKMPQKLKDPWSFSIPCVIGKFVIDKALCNLGASVSLMPLLISERLNLGNLKSSRMSLQLADHSVKYPVRILENVPVRIGQMYIPTDFIVMDIKEDSSVPILLGRPFLATAWAIIDVKRGKLTF
ncbi:uncharacterized protein LOC127136071 [Lathyrus oleraceus]|uniref:uncharacterized protein LOC127136071 n=1 Tax=Pisum sativum TaxID=3888 RepID=UPI0021CFD461|nr:uncharacterized protein LOC127136071 [Pisum sativum]